MKRTPLRRGKPLKRTGYIKRSNPKRKAERLERDFGDLADIVRAMPCYVCARWDLPQFTPTQACHVKSRGAGGHARLDSGDGNLVAMCDAHHRQQHQKGWSSMPGGRKEAEALAKEIGERQ